MKLLVGNSAVAGFNELKNICILGKGNIIIFVQAVGRIILGWSVCHQ